MIRFNRMFHYKPTILGYLHLWKPPSMSLYWTCYILAILGTPYKAWSHRMKRGWITSVIKLCWIKTKHGWIIQKLLIQDHKPVLKAENLRYETISWMNNTEKMDERKRAHGFPNESILIFPCEIWCGQICSLLPISLV